MNTLNIAAPVHFRFRKCNIYPYPSLMEGAICLCGSTRLTRFKLNLMNEVERKRWLRCSDCGQMYEIADEKGAADE